MKKLTEHKTLLENMIKDRTRNNYVIPQKGCFTIKENFVEKATLENGINILYSYSLPGYTWKAGLKKTKIKLVFIKDKELLLLLENNIRGGISSVTSLY